MKIRYYLDNWVYWVDFDPEEPRNADDSIILDATEQERNYLAQCTLEEVEKRVRLILSLYW